MAHKCACGVTMTRRLMLGATTAAACAGIAPRASALPAEVAGVALPQSDIARRAAALSQSACPDFLYNHCMRAYVFGAIYARQNRISFNADEAFVAAAIHDLGLLPAFASPNGSFEFDGADAAETFARQHGLDASAADIVWHAVAMHDTRFARRQGPEAIVMAQGAGTDVNGPDDTFTADEVAAVVAVFPRLQFKTRFTALLVDQCRRKALSQSCTWLEPLCREVSPSVWPTNIEQSIAASSFSE